MPKVPGGPEELNDLLESVYGQCISDGGSETSCSKQAWAAAKNAGWKQNDDGIWVKKIFHGIINLGNYPSTTSKSQGLI